MKNINLNSSNIHGKMIDTAYVKDSYSEHKGNKKNENNQENLVVYKDVANQQAVRLEIGDVLKVFDRIISDSVNEVNESRSLNEIKYSQRGYYSQDINATIKSKIIIEMGYNSEFSQKIKLRSNRGSIFFVIKDKYILYVKRLYGRLNKPNSYPTLSSSKLFKGELFPDLAHLPILFVGPNLSSEENNSFITSLISKYEVNWTQSTTNLFDVDANNINLLSSQIQSDDDQREILKVKEEKIIKRKIVE